jgi:hypothetical protein
VICDYIEANKAEHGVEPVCTALSSAGVKIAPSSYYAARNRPPSVRAVRDEAVKAEICRVQRRTTGSTASARSTPNYVAKVWPPKVARSRGAPPRG